MLAVFVIGCGSGGLTDPAPTPTPAPGPTPTPLSTVTGVAVDGFIAGATVRAYKIDALGGRGDQIGAATTTDAYGNYSLTLDYTGPVMIECVGGTYKDWATGNTVSVTSPLTALMPNATGAVTVNVTPLTHMAALRARQDIQSNKGDVATTIDAVNKKIAEYFGIVDIIKDVPIDPTIANSAVGIAYTRRDYALVLGGISQRAKDGGMDPFSLVSALGKDAEDGVFDGKQNGVQLKVTNAGGVGTTDLDPADAKANLAAGIKTFQGPAGANKSGEEITSAILDALEDKTNSGVIASSPDKPSNFSVAAVSGSQIDLAWSAVVGAAGYKIYKAGVYLKSVTSTTASDTGLEADTAYCYAVQTYDASGRESSLTVQLCATTNIVAPPMPSGLTVTAVSQAQINLSWTAAAGASSYKIYRDGELLKTVGSTSFSDTGLNSDTQYCYAVSSADAAGNESVRTAQLCATTNMVAPPVPTGLTVTAFSSSRIDLTWTAAAGATGYRVYRDGKKRADVTAPALSDTGLTPSTSFCYSVSSLDAFGNESMIGSQLCATTHDLPPADPAGVVAYVETTTKVVLNWIAATGVSQYIIYRDGIQVGASLTPTWTDTTATANTKYTYRVTSVGPTGSASSGAASSVAADTGLTVPSGVTATVDSSTQITLSWAQAPGASVKGYKVYKNGELLAAIGAVATTSIVDGGLEPNTMYCYAVSSTDVSGGESAKSAAVCGTTEAPPVPDTVDLLVSSPQLNSDGTSPVTLTALVKDAHNRAMAGQEVTFTADSGILSELSVSTDANGTATAKLNTGGDPSKRAIALTVLAGSKTDTNSVSVTGTNISIDPPSFSLLFNDADGKELTVTLKDSSGGAIPGEMITLTPSLGSKFTLDCTSCTTDNSGQVKFTVKNAEKGGTITASSIGVEAQSTLTINNAKLTVDVPPANAEISISAPPPPQSFTVTYTENGAPVAAKTVYFTATRGTLTASSAVTDATGQATVTISSVNSGPAVLTAYTTGDPQASAQVAVTFVAPDADKMDLSAFPATINTNAAGQTGEQSLIKAIVRDANDNLVKGKTVEFRIVQDASAGTLSKASAVTDQYGTATVNYIAGGATGGLNNVQIEAKVQDKPSVSKTTTLTVGGQALFISLATGPEIVKVDPNKFQKNYVALVTDAAGRPVEGAVVTASVTPMYFWKGYWTISGGAWAQVNTISLANATNPAQRACANEDGLTQNPLYDYNGVLDVGEDQNANSRLDPGNVASVTATPTDSTGHSTVGIVYARDYAYWVNVRLEVRASLYGSTASAVQTFILPGDAADYSDINKDPPGNPSPFGANSTCYAALTAMRLSDTKISLNWDPSGYALSYNIYRYPYDSVTPAGKIQNAYTKTSFEDTDANTPPVVSKQGYCYEIKVNPVGGGVETPLAPQGNKVCVADAP